MEIGTIVSQAPRSRDFVPSLPVASEQSSSAPQVDSTKVSQVADLPGRKAVESSVSKPAQHLTNAYAVSDKRFTIYKSPNGEYITRFTDLRDGKVTYVPNQDMVEFLNSYRPPPESRLEIFA